MSPYSVSRCLEYLRGSREIAVNILVQSGVPEVGLHSLLERCRSGAFSPELRSFDKADDHPRFRRSYMVSETIRCCSEWGFNGAHYYPAYFQMMLQEADGVILAYSVSSRASFDELVRILDLYQSVHDDENTTVRKERKKSVMSSAYRRILNLSRSTSEEDNTNCVKKETRPIMLVACKVDLPPEEWEVSAEDGRQFADSIGADFVETSSKEGTGVQEMEEKIVRSTFAYRWNRSKDGLKAKWKEEKAAKKAAEKAQTEA